MLAASIAVLVIHPAAAQSKRGIWTGTSATQQGSQPFTIVLDSTASGWKGSAVAPSTMNDSLRLVEVSVRADTVEFGIPVNGVTVYISGVVVGDRLSGQIWMQNNNVGSIQLTRKTVPVDKPPSDKSNDGPTAFVWLMTCGVPARARALTTALRARSSASARS
jgi:hypothetical protein